jgi:mono/diheme cytochrome c family protein
MWQTNLKILLIVLGTLGLYTWVASSIPQVASAVPEELAFSGDVSADDLVMAGEQLYAGAGTCVACHGLGTRAPNLLTDHAGEGTIGQRCGSRVSGLDCKAYLLSSLTEPASFVVDGFPEMVFQARTFSDAQIWSLVAFLQSLGGEVTVTGDDLESAGDSAEGASAPAGPSQTTDARALLQENSCLGCHAIDGSGAPLGPNFDDIGGARTAAQIRNGILDPNADAAPGFDAMLGVMPTTFGQSLSATQLEAMVTFLAARK